MIKQLCICKVVRGRNVWVVTDRSDPGLENLLPVFEYKVAETGDCFDRRPPLTVTSDGRILPNLISEGNTCVALGETIITKKIQIDGSKPADAICGHIYGVRKILPV